jgi:hypothetical protein
LRGAEGAQAKAEADKKRQADNTGEGETDKEGTEAIQG